MIHGQQNSIAQTGKTMPGGLGEYERVSKFCYYISLLFCFYVWEDAGGSVMVP